VLIGTLTRRTGTRPVVRRLDQGFFKCQDKFGHNALIQEFEDFGNQNAFRLLQEYQDKPCTFNDGIQGTGAGAVARLVTSTRLTEKYYLSVHTFLFLGAGEESLPLVALRI
jgi:malate dehydrogenase (oxaloacetate-decarboxylating)(NADP+)